MDRNNISRRKLPQLLLHSARKALNNKGSALLLALVLSMAVLPTAVTLASIARSDLRSARDDYHRRKVDNAVQGALALVEADLLADGDGQVVWPDLDVSLDISVTETEQGFQVNITAYSDRAVVVAKTEVETPEQEVESEEGEQEAESSQ